jgi:hypothetical protein
MPLTGLPLSGERVKGIGVAAHKNVQLHIFVAERKRFS